MANFPTYWETGRRPRREIELAPAWKDVTDTYEYEDGGADFNERSDVAPIRWEYVVDCPGTTAAEARSIASTYHDFYNTYRHSQPFDFKDKFGTTWINVRIESYDRTHEGHKSWDVACSFVLVSFDGDVAPTVPEDLEVTAVTFETLTLEWSASTD